MPHYELICSHAGCTGPAEFKIAARWSDGITQELKTYTLACQACLPELYRQARVKQSTCRLALGESLEQVGIYHLTRGSRDRQLTRRPELEIS